MGIIKEVKRTANVAWSPRSMQSIYLAAGTVAQQLDATFSTTASLEVFALHLNETELDMPRVGHVETKQRFHKLIWSGHGGDDMGVVLGGSDNGIITIWNMDKLIKSEEPLVATLQEHVGAVRSLDVNPFQPNLIASGASESEVYIWDLNNTTTPMSPGSKPHPLEDISGLAWNRQVQHILASTSPGGRSIVWDLRKNEPIIQVSDSNSRVRCKDIAWHPDVATQMVTCSEDDRSPVIQLWDLRYATAPFRTLERHQRGVLSLAWCSQDSDLLLSAAKDNHIYCWNPNTDVTGGEVVYELPATSQWIFECAWCPRNPAIISTSSFDGHISLYSILGGGTSCRSSSKPQSITDSNDPFSNISSPKQVEKESIPLKSPPKWFRRPCGARFGFGGQLVSFSSKNYNKVNVNVVITEPQLVQQSEIFEDVINQQKFGQFCEGKLSASEEQDKMIWSFLKVTFEADPRRHYLNLLGYNPVQLAQQVTKWVESCKAPPSDYVHIEEVQEEIATLPLDNENEEEQLEEDKNTSTASLFGDSSVDNTFDDFKVEPIPPAKEGLDFSIDADNADGMLTQALLVGNFKAAVDICINADRMSEALILSVAGGSDLFQSTQKLFFEKNESSTTKLISLITSRNWSEIVQYGNLDNWREILAVLVTYATNEDFAKLCDILGERLEEEGRDGCYSNAALCYICSGNINKFVDCCLRSHESIDTDPMSLQEFVEMVTLLRQAVMLRRKSATIDNPLLSDKLSKYVSLLASQGSLQIALLYLQHTNTQQLDIRILYDRLYQCVSGGINSNLFPFDRVDILPPSGTAGSGIPLPSSSTANTTITTPIYNAYRGNMEGASSSREHPTHVYGGPTNMMGGAGYSNYQPHVGGAYNKSDHPPYQPINPVGGAYNKSDHPPYQPINPVGGAHNKGDHPPYQPIDPMGGAHNKSDYPPYQPINPPGHFTHGVSNTPPSPGNPVNMLAGSHPPAPPTHTIAAWNDPPTLRHTKKTTNYVAPPPMRMPLASTQETQPNQAPPIAPPPDNKPGTPTKPTPVVATPSEPQSLPQEHAIIHTVLNGLLIQCKARANNIVMKRKVDDIQRKLEVLYDLIRQGRLSHDVLQGLHAIIYDVQGMNYAGGLVRLNHMVAASNLSEITSFMPAVKTLLQLGIQLKV